MKDKEILWNKVNRMVKDHVMDLGGTQIIRMYKDETVTYVIGISDLGYFAFTANKLETYVAFEFVEEVFTNLVMKRLADLKQKR